ncbi:MAG: 2-hydroxyacid dehydrogenase [Chloroflexota bacterium]
MQTLHVHMLGDDPALPDGLRGLVGASVTLTAGALPPPQTTLLIGGRPDAAQLDACPDLRALVIPFAGLPEATAALMRERPHINVHNLHHNASMTAEMAVALLLAVAKRLVSVHNAFTPGDWRPRFDAPRNVHLDGETALILGYGAIGRRVGAVCAALGMHVIGVRRQPDGDPQVYTPDALPDLLPQARALICCLPATDATRGMIGAAELALLPRGAVLVNVGRAAVIDEAALFEALQSGHLYGAGLDVWYSYPADVESRAAHPPSAYPFHTLGNVVMSPHRAGGFGAAEVEQARLAALAVVIGAYARGEPAPNRVDLDAGY